MSFIQTILGKIAPEQLGATDCHNHTFITGGMPVLRYPDFRLDNYEKIATEIAEFRRAGGNAIVDMSPIDWGKDIEAMIRLSHETGVDIIASTGFHKLFYYLDTHWVHKYEEEEILQIVLMELLEGIDINNNSGPLVRRSSAKAGVIKVGTQTSDFSRTEKKLLRVAAAAHLKTGAPILTHTDEGALAFEQISYLTSLGVRPERIGLSHVDRRLELEFHLKLAELGVYLEYDSIPRITKGFDVSTLHLVVEMARCGFSGNILLGSDISRQTYWKAYGGSPGLAFLMSEFRDRLSQSGMPTTVVTDLYEGNPRRFLEWKN